jgi:hypothetical protein
MPRVHRLACAEEHPNSIVGCIMLVQEKMKFLGRSLLRCHCSSYEAELVSLREELSLLREQFQAQRNSLRRLHLRGQEAMAQYRGRINSLLQVNSRRLVLERRQMMAVQYEVWSLHDLVAKLRSQLQEANITPHPPAPATVVAWHLQPTTPASWVVSKEWQALHPGEEPSADPNPPKN